MSSALLSLSEPCFFRVIDSHSVLTTVLWSLQREERDQRVVRHFRGKQMRTVEDMFDEFAAVLQFPYYFGGNWAAFDECLRDLEWLPAKNYVLTIFDSSYFLAEDKVAELDRMLDLLKSVCTELSKPITSGESWDRPAASFHVVFHCTPEDIPRLPSIIKEMPELKLSENA